MELIRPAAREKPGQKMTGVYLQIADAAVLHSAHEQH